MQKNDEKVELGQVQPHEAQGKSAWHKSKGGDKVAELTQFVEGTTMHGLNHVFTADTRRIRRILWLCLILTMLGSFVATTVSSVTRYYRYESTTKIERVSVEVLDLPAVSICHEAIIAHSTLSDDPEAAYWFEQLMTNYGTFGNDSIHQARTALRRHNMMWTTFRHLQDIILACTVNLHYDCRHLFGYTLSDKGICLTLQSYDITQQHGILHSQLPGEGYGINIWLDRLGEDILARLHDGAGVKVVVHDPQKPIRVNEQAISIAPGSEASIRIEKHVIKSLDKPYSAVSCMKDVTSPKYKSDLEYDEYSYEGCMLDCLIEHVIVNCNCTYTLDAETGCTMEDYIFCSLEQYNIHFSNCKNCLYPCTDTRYSMDLTTLSLPGDPTQSYFHYNTADDIQNNLILLHVYYPSLHYTVTAQVESFTLDTLISNLGGQIGLFLGASLMTLVELIEGLGFIVWTAYQRKRSQRNHVKPLAKLRV